VVDRCRFLSDRYCRWDRFSLWFDRIRNVGSWCENEGVSTAPAEVIEADTETVVVNDRPWKVIVWNDPINLMSYVTLVLQQLFGYSKAKAEKLMLDVHEKGRAIVNHGPREQAELDVFRLHEKGLWATMEQDD
jgi:ATP-dependent Clp protease adaptor protein ClpS